MKVSPFSSFRLEDFPTEREWIDTLFLPLNNVLSQITQALNGRLSSDNIPTFTKTFEGSNLSLPQSFQNTLAGFIPTQMVVAQAFKAGKAIAMVGAWSQSGDTITVNELFEVTAAGNVPLSTGPKYQIVLKFT